MGRTLGLVSFCLVALLACDGQGPVTPVPPEQRNLLLLTVDTLRADHLGAYGYPRETSPAIDALARQGVLFEAPIVQRGGTWPSLTSILTSLHPRTHGVRRNGEQLDASRQSLAERLQERDCPACQARHLAGGGSRTLRTTGFLPGRGRRAARTRLHRMTPLPGGNAKPAASEPLSGQAGSAQRPCSLIRSTSRSAATVSGI
jgi:hypothetical protein